jgi:hypothetical protein
MREREEEEISSALSQATLDFCALQFEYVNEKIFKCGTTVE